MYRPPNSGAITSQACHTLDSPGPRSEEKVKNTFHASRLLSISGRFTASQAPTVPARALRNGPNRRERTARISRGPRMSSG